MWLPAILCMSLVSVTCGGLIYSSSYANVRYQGAAKDDSESDSTSTKEEVTIPPEFDEVNPTVDPDTATEPYSETVNATKVYKSHGPKKIHERIELEEELEPTGEPDLEPTDSSVREEKGIYYIYHPSGLLQRVIFATRDDLANMEYLANFNYRNVEPIAAPIYTYDPNTLVLQTLQLEEF